MGVKSLLLEAIEPLIGSMRAARLYPNNNSSIVVVEGDIGEITNLVQKMVELGYRLKGSIQLVHNVKCEYQMKDSFSGRYKDYREKRSNGVATFIHEEQFLKSR